MTILVANNAVGALASSINDSVLSLSLGSGQGALFPSPGAGEFFYVTLTRASDSGIEIMKCTARSTDTLTVVRAQDGTTAKSFAASDRVELRPIRAVHLNYAQLDTANAFTASQTVTGDVTASGTVQGADLVATDDLTVGDDATIGDDLAVGGDLTVTGAITVTGNATFNGTNVLKGSAKIDALPTGVTLPMRQASVPTGWTKDTTYNNAALRIVSGTPSQQATAGKEFTTLLAARTLVAANIPDLTISITDPGHAHRTKMDTESCDDSNQQSVWSPTGTGTDNAGPLSGTATTGITAAFGSAARGGAQTSIDFAVNYVDVYLASKNA